ncbi:MAG: hypothetical protein R3284_05515, partial [Rubricoccaceae bacterium]|nr:hypothetical protein [Rubricoccaceae bacterium]
MKWFSVSLFGLAFTLTGSAGIATADTTTELSFTATNAERCDVTIRGQHGGASGNIELQLGESQVRNRVGWWATIGGGIVTLESRERFSEVVNLDFNCNAHR